MGGLPFVPPSTIIACLSLFFPFSPASLLFPGVRQSCRYGRLESLENVGSPVASHVLHKVMTRAPSRTRRQFDSYVPAYVSGEEKERETGRKREGRRKREEKRERVIRPIARSGDFRGEKSMGITVTRMGQCVSNLWAAPRRRRRGARSNAKR